MHYGYHRNLKTLYYCLASLTFVLELVCVLTATISYTNIAAVGTATGYSAIAYLMNAHELEFLVIRGSFTLGCFLFLSSLIARTWLQFGE
jgi:hypothetical protein